MARIRGQPDMLEMVWSKLKKRFESLFAKSLEGRLQVHLTEYSRRSPWDVGRGWLTLDGVEVVSVQVPSCFSDNFDFRAETRDFGKAIYEYLGMSIAEAKASDDELIRGFVFLDRRVGKRALAAVESHQLQPFARVLFQLRCEAEAIQGSLVSGDAGPR